MQSKLAKANKAIILASMAMLNWSETGRSLEDTLTTINHLVSRLQACPRSAPNLDFPNPQLVHDIYDFHKLYRTFRGKIQLGTNDSKSQQHSSQLLQEMLSLPPECEQFLNHPHLPKTKLISRYKNRGPYRSYTTQEKDYVVYLHSTGRTFASISKQLEIPQKNVVRWCREGYSSRDFNKNTGEASWHSRLAGWLHLQKQTTSVSSRELQEKAIELSGNRLFRVSRGWMKSFLAYHDPHGSLNIVGSEGQHD